MPGFTRLCKLLHRYDILSQYAFRLGALQKYLAKHTTGSPSGQLTINERHPPRISGPSNKHSLVAGQVVVGRTPSP